MFINSRGQSGLEYLMTYGWSLIVIVAIIAALVLLLNPPIEKGITCNPKLGDFLVQQHSILPTQTQFVILNSSPTPITGLSFAVSGTAGGQPFSDNAPIVTPTQLNPAAVQTLTINHSQLPAGEFVLDYTMTYKTNYFTQTAKEECKGRI